MDKYTQELIAGLDKNTLDALSRFGGDYMTYLWWKELVIPNVWWLFIVSLVFVAVIYWIKKLAIMSDERMARRDRIIEAAGVLCLYEFEGSGESFDNIVEELKNDLAEEKKETPTVD